MSGSSLNELHKQWLKRPGYKAAYDALEEEFSIASALIEARASAGLTQEQLAAHVVVEKGKYFNRGKFNQDLLKKSAASLTALYRNEGFTKAKVAPEVAEHDANIEVMFHIDEGPQDRVHELKIVDRDNQPVRLKIGRRPLQLAALGCGVGDRLGQRHAHPPGRRCVCRRRLSGAATDHQTFQQAVGRQPIGAVHPGAGHLAHCVEPRQLGLAVHIGDDPAAAAAENGQMRWPGRQDRATPP